MREPILRVLFYRSESGTEPVRDWLSDLTKADRKAIGEDIKTAQYGWPMGMPLIRKLEKDLWEVRTRLRSGIARVFFVVLDQQMVLLHGIVKKTQKTQKTQKTPQNELAVARKRRDEVLKG